MNVAEPKNMTHQNPPQFPEEEPKKTQQPDDVAVHVETRSSGMETCQYDGCHGNDRVINNEGSSLLQGRRSSPGPVVAVDDVTKEAMGAEDNGRERLKRHRIEVAAGRVWIPEIWGQEELLKDWIDCSAFDASLVPRGIMSARAALVQEGRRANSGGFRIENRC